MYKVKLYIEGKEVELFKDETITLNSSVQNISDISKVFTDYTQSFTIPASSVNNKLFIHWYNVAITGGFNASVRKSATIKLNFLTFRTGLVQLNGVEMQNNKPYSYKITFYGDLVNLSDLFGEDVLNDLTDLDSYNHDYTSNKVKSGIQGTSILSGNIIYPLIADENWTWDSQTTTLSDTDILYDAGNTNGIAWNHMKPALKIARILEAIESEYTITFDSDLFASSDFEKIYMWCSPSKDPIEVYGTYTHVICDNETITHANYDNVTGEWTLADTATHKYTMLITPATGYDGVLYSMAFYINGSLYTEVTNQTGDSSLLINYAGAVTDVITIYVNAQTSFDFDASFESIGQFAADTSTVSSLTVTGYVYMSDKTVSTVFHKGIMPDIKVGDFLMGIIKMFNLAIIPSSSTNFTILPLQDWYDAGTARDISEYVFADKHTISRPELDKRISFKYQESKTILAEQYRETNNIGYGDLEADFDYDGSTLEIETPFENLIGERISSVNDGSISDIHVYKVIDKDLVTVDIKPFLFYLKGQTTLTSGTNGISFANDTGTLQEITVYNNIGQENFLTDAAITNSLNFGSEISTWTYSQQTESLYSNYWQGYVSNLYDSTRRVFKYKAVLPLNILTQIALNDILIIRERSYIINTMKINLTSGITNFELLNYIGEITGNVVNYYFEYDLNIQL